MTLPPPGGPPPAINPTAVDSASQETAVGPLGPGSLAWRLGFPRVGLLLAGRALLLQVAHPTVGAGVRDHSTYRTDPWGRLEHTVESLLQQLFGGEASIAEARRLRELHRGITGTGFSGRRYSALEPEAGAWVHLVNFETVVLSHELLGRPIGAAGTRRLYDEWRRVGLLLGIPDGHLPAGVDELPEYVDTTIATRLEPNPTTRGLLDALTLRDVESPGPMVPGALWRGVRRPAGVLLVDLTVGTSPPAFRDLLGLEWTRRRQRRLDRLTAAVKVVSPFMPERVGHYPLARQARAAARRAAVTGPAPLPGDHLAP